MVARGNSNVACGRLDVACGGKALFVVACGSLDVACGRLNLAYAVVTPCLWFLAVVEMLLAVG